MARNFVGANPDSKDQKIATKVRNIQAALDKIDKGGKEDATIGLQTLMDQYLTADVLTDLIKMFPGEFKDYQKKPLYTYKHNFDALNSWIKNMNQISIEDLRSFYPQYSDLSDEELANKYTDKTGNEVIFSQSIEEPKSLIPEAGTYSQDDIAEDDNMYYIVEGYMSDRYGPQSIEGESRESVVDSFLNNRRGVVSGNTVRGLSEMDYINDIKNDSQKSARAAAAYQLYENMAGIFSGETTIGEKAEGVMDFTRSVVLDPVNLIGGLIGKAAANGSLRAGTYAAKRAALEAGLRFFQKEVAEKVITKTFTAGLKASRTATKAKIGHYAKQTLGRTAAQRCKKL